MDRIYEQAKDQHVVAVKVYVKANDAYAYSNSGKTTKITAAVLQDMFNKGMIIIDGGNTYIPVKLNVTSGVAVVTYVKADATTATTAVLATLASEEYTAG